MNNIILTLNEFNNFDNNEIVTTYGDDLTIGFEIELEFTNFYFFNVKNRIRIDETLLNINTGENSFDEHELKMYNNLMSNYMNSFYKKYNKDYHLIFDSSLTDGIEIVSKPFNSIDKAKKYLEDFFIAFDKQKIFKFENTTGIHINISLKSADKLNYFKLFLFLNDEIDKKYGFIYNDFQERFRNKWVRPIKQKILDIVDNDVENDTMFINDANKIISKFFSSKVNKKVYGLVIKETSYGSYFEFRHIGGNKVTLEKILTKLNYFCYLTVLASVDDYKKKEYLKKLYKFRHKDIEDNMIRKSRYL